MKKYFNKKWLLIPAILLPLATGFIGSLFTRTGIDTWYTTISKPSFNPPNWIFSPVWTTLFILMGIAFYLILKKERSNKKKQALFLFYLQLAFNLLWSIVFFYFQQPGLAFLEIIILWILILATIIYFWRLSKTAAYLLIPYLAWVTFASFLNYAIWMLN